VIVYGPTTDGNGALDVNGTFLVNGGTLIALGSSGMAESPDTSSTQGWVQASLSGSAGTTVSITQSNATIAQFVAKKAFANVVYSSSAITSGQTYTVTAGSSSVSATAGQATAGGMGGGGQGGAPRR
jgi:hypothetical protein